MFNVEPNWLSVDNLSGTLGQGNFARIFLMLHSEDLLSGQYHLDMMISSNDPITPVKKIPVNMTIQPVSVIEKDSKIPDKFMLAQNYPNPFNPETRIAFSIPVKLYVKILVFNEIGERVKEMTYGYLEAGNYEFLFNAKLPSGIYYYRLEAGNFSTTKKMIILKY